MIAFWERVNKLLKENNISQEILAKRTEIPANTIFSQISKGILPKTLDALEIAEALNVKLEYLVYGNSSKKEKKQNTIDSISKMLEKLPPKEIDIIHKMISGLLK